MSARARCLPPAELGIGIADRRPWARRILGTPTEEDWPGVKQLPDYKPSFPQWSRQDIAATVPTLDDDGLDLLQATLIYDTAKRISGRSLPPCELRHSADPLVASHPAKRALAHPYLLDYPRGT